MVSETYNFTDDMQDMLLACLITYPEKFFGFGQIIKSAYFNGPAAIEVVHAIQDYAKKYGKYPGFTLLGNYAYRRAARTNQEHAKDMLEYVERLAQVDTSDWKGALDIAVDFAKERAIYDAITQIVNAQTSGKMSEVNVVDLMEKAVSVGTDLSDLGLSLYHDSDKVIDRICQRDYGVMTGYPEFDKLWKFGWAPGWLIVLLAPPKRFKTAMALNLALNMACDSKADVLYYACEISEELAMLRAYCNLTGYTQDEILDNPEKYKARIKSRLKQRLYGQVFFKDYPSKGATIGDIRDHAKHVIQILGIKPKAIFIDYAETVKPSLVSKDAPDWREQSSIYVQARALGSELGCCVVMPDRCNRETMKQVVPTASSFQGAVEKGGVVDVGIGLCADDSEYMQNRIRYFVFLNRHGVGFKHYAGRVDPTVMRMTVDKEIPYDPEEAENLAKERNFGRKEKKLSKAALDYELTQHD